MKEFICPNGRMSVNGVCPIFEGDDGQTKDFLKKSTFDSEKEDEFMEDKKSFFEWDMDKPTEATFKSASQLISENLNSYNSFVEEKLGIPSNIQTGLRTMSALSGFANYGLVGAVTPFALPFIAGGILNQKEEKQQQAAINREEVRDLQTRIDKGEFGSNTPTPQDDYRGGGQYSTGNTKSSSGGSKSGGFSSAERGAALHG
tara:strand:- start:90 stop:695 length:606 start_codon:yes stop_codon:yes gene_type:complete